MKMVLTTAPTSRLKEIFDPDLILGLALSTALDFALCYVARFVFTPLTGRPFAFLGSAYDVMAWDDVLMFAIEIGGVLLTKGRLRKIFIYALWFSICVYFAINLSLQTIHFNV